MEIFKIQMFIEVISFIIHFPVCYYFIFYLELGVIGTGIAYSVTFTFSFLFLLSYVYIFKPMH